jgi:putative addiction module component (TIGR02574 family)
MHATAKSLGIDRLSLAERILLVDEIWDSIAAEAGALEVLQSHKGELDR